MFGENNYQSRNDHWENADADWKAGITKTGTVRREAKLFNGWIGCWFSKIGVIINDNAIKLSFFVIFLTVLGYCGVERERVKLEGQKIF